MKRLDELTGIFSRRVVSRPVKVTAMGNIEQRSCAIVQIPAKIGHIAVTLAQEDQGGDSLLKRIYIRTQAVTKDEKEF